MSANISLNGLLKAISSSYAWMRMTMSGNHLYPPSSTTYTSLMQYCHNILDHHQHVKKYKTSAHRRNLDFSQHLHYQVRLLPFLPQMSLGPSHTLDRHSHWNLSWHITKDLSSPTQKTPRFWPTTCWQIHPTSTSTTLATQTHRTYEKTL